MNKKSATALAGTMGPVTEQPSWTWVAELSVGSVWERGGSTQTFYLTPEIEKSYVASQSTNTPFDGEVFLGVQKTLNEHWLIGVGYEFVDWGKSQLGRAADQTLGSGLTLNHLYTNGVLFNLTYLA